MGTRGTFGFRIDGEDKLTYNHFDSYPNGLGNTVVEFIRDVGDWDKVKELARNLQDVGDREPTPEDIKACAPYMNLSVSNQDTKDWYCLLRQTQGNPAAILEIGLFQQENNFINDSLFCEYGYIINLDDMTFEVYEGFQKAKHNKGRYANNPKDNDYYPSALVGTFPLNNIPENWAKLAYRTEEEEEEPVEEVEEVEENLDRKCRMTISLGEMKDVMIALQNISGDFNIENVAKRFKEKLKKERVSI